MFYFRILNPPKNPSENWRNAKAQPVLGKVHGVFHASKMKTVHIETTRWTESAVSTWANRSLHEENPQTWCECWLLNYRNSIDISTIDHNDMGVMKART